MINYLFLKNKTNWKPKHHLHISIVNNQSCKRQIQNITQLNSTKNLNILFFDPKKKKKILPNNFLLLNDLFSEKATKKKQSCISKEIKLMVFSCHFYNRRKKIIWRQKIKSQQYPKIQGEILSQRLVCPISNSNFSSQKTHINRWF